MHTAAHKDRKRSSYHQSQSGNRLSPSATFKIDRMVAPAILSVLEEQNSRTSIPFNNFFNPGFSDYTDTRAFEVISDILERFFEENSKLFSSLEYRRLLIFVKCLAELRESEEYETLFQQLGQNNPLFDEAVVHLSLELEWANSQMTIPESQSDLNKFWTDTVLQEISKVEKMMDP